MKNIFLICFAVLLSACTNSDDAERALSAEGMTNIRITGYDWFACSKDDWYHTGFTATNSQGKQVSGVVCSGLIFKAATVRY